MINHLRDDKDRLVSDKDRLLNDKEKLVNERISLVSDTRALLEDNERTLKDANDLVTSKSVLWQDFYRAVEVRDEGIKQLKEEKSVLKEANLKLERKLGKQQKKNRDLARALDELIEKDDGGEDDAAGTRLKTCHLRDLSTRSFTRVS